MASSAKQEEVLMAINHVRYQRVDGTFYLLTERLAWAPAAKQNITLSLKYADMRQQKISPDAKEKIQMQIVMADDASHVFQFVNTKNRESQLEDRNSVVSMLQPLIQKFQRKITNEIESKNKVLASNHLLFSLYKELVVPGIVTADEFWTSHAKELEEAQNPTSSSNSGGKDVGQSVATNSQRVGIQASFLSSLKPHSDEESGGIRYNLTSDTIEAIFRTYPSVKLKHAEYVPHSMSEGDFWAQFFQSHYFHRDRLDNGKNLFAGDLTVADSFTSSMLLEGDPFINVSAFIDSDATIASMAGDSYVDKSAVEQTSKQRQQQSGKITPAHINRLIIQRVNFHSERVLTAQVDGDTPSPAKRTKQVAERVLIGDLINDAESSANAPGLDITNTDAYSFSYASGGEALSNFANVEKISDGDVRNFVDMFRDELANYQPSPFNAFVDDADQNAGVYAEIASTNGDSSQAPHASVNFASLCGGNFSSALEAEYKGLYAALSELLRHFWTCFPVTSPQLEQKLLRMRETLSTFNSGKLRSFEQRLSSSGVQSVPTITSHLHAMLDAAQRKFDMWQSRKSNVGVPK